MPATVLSGRDGNCQGATAIRSSWANAVASAKGATIFAGTVRTTATLQPPARPSIAETTRGPSRGDVGAVSLVGPLPAMHRPVTLTTTPALVRTRTTSSAGAREVGPGGV